MIFASLVAWAQRPPYVVLLSARPTCTMGNSRPLHEVLVHYNNSPMAIVGKSELPGPRNMTPQQLGELEAFLRTLNVDDSPAK